MNQRISQLIDDELNPKESLELLSQIRNDVTLRDKLSRYQAIGESIKSGKYQAINADFSRSIAEKLKLEPAFLLPQRKPAISKTKIYATAASVLVVTALAGQTFWQNQSVSNPSPVTVASIDPQDKLSVSNQTKPPQAKNKPLSAEFNAYLQAHNSSYYTNGEAYFQPDAKVVSFGRQ